MTIIETKYDKRSTRVCLLYWLELQELACPKMSYFLREQKFFKESDKGSPKKNSCEIWLKSSKKFLKRNF